MLLLNTIKIITNVQGTYNQLVIEEGASLKMEWIQQKI